MSDGMEENLRARLQRRERELEVIRRITSGLHARIKLPDLIRQTLDAAVETVDAAAGSILLHEPKTNKLVFRYVIGDKADELTGFEMDAGQGIVGQVFASGAGRIDQDVQKIEGDGIANPAVRFHIWVYRARPDVHAIVHTHPPAVSALSMTGRPLTVAHMDATMLWDDCAWLSEWPGPPVGDEEGRIISDALGAKRTILIALLAAITLQLFEVGSGEELRSYFISVRDAAAAAKSCAAAADRVVAVLKEQKAEGE